MRSMGHGLGSGRGLILPGIREVSQIHSNATVSGGEESGSREEEEGTFCLPLRRHLQPRHRPHPLLWDQLTGLRSQDGNKRCRPTGRFPLLSRLRRDRIVRRSINTSNTSNGDSSCCLEGSIFRTPRSGLLLMAHGWSHRLTTTRTPKMVATDKTHMAPRATIARRTWRLARLELATSTIGGAPGAATSSGGMSRLTRHGRVGKAVSGTTSPRRNEKWVGSMNTSTG